ncbi:MAG: tetratricopeptide repeat protein [Kofleriaceae bacterium]|nr:tetratricopeptide repeat protein [Kofleriaceae bacterium]
MTSSFRLLAASLAVLASTRAFAQPAARDDKQLAEALMTEGVRLLQDKAYEQALANFLEAYAKVPSPRILLNIGSTLRDMGRLADAANTYQRYILEPGPDDSRVAEVKALLTRLDEQLTLLTIRVNLAGAEVSIDAGPFIPVGRALVTRVRPGIHLVRARLGEGSTEISINGFEGEHKAIDATIDAPPPELDRKLLTMPEQVDGWLITGRQYASGEGGERRVRAGFGGDEIPALIPHHDDDDLALTTLFDDDADRITSGAMGVLRIDGKGRGFAGGVGLAVSRKRLEAELMYLRSNLNGGYIGIRLRLLTGTLRPYVGGGVPGFAYDYTDEGGGMSTKLAVGLRAAAGVELRINGHLSVQGDVGYEHFFVPADAGFEKNVFVPTLGMIGRL